ncbi:MAG TPA: pilin, partial [Candidatus Paceibacterota bacterium]|nr:pilin [Candidatus Paceibacterota bacterium]
MKKLNQIIFIFLLFILSFGQAFGEEYWQCEKIEGSGSLFFNDESSCDISSNPPYKQCKTGTCKKIDTEGSWVCTGLNAQTDIYFIGDEAGCKNFQEANPLKCNCAKEGAGVNIVPVDLLPNSTREDRPNGYKLLAPIGNLDFVSYDPGEDNFVGNYLAIIFKLAIGIISALAVIMLIVAGIQYMGEDSIFGKTKAKNQMTNAILGLLIALGSYAILYTISPDLIGNKGLSIKKISIELPDSGDDSVDPNCKEGGGA